MYEVLGKEDYGVEELLHGVVMVGEMVFGAIKKRKI